MARNKIVLVGAGEVGIVVGPFDDGIVALDRRALGNVERLSLRHALDNVDEHDVAQFSEPGEEGDGAADLPGATAAETRHHHGTQQDRARRRRAAQGLAS